MSGFGEILDRFVRGDVSKRLEKAEPGGESRELIYRAMVARQIAKHTGLPHSAKACRPATCWRGKAGPADQTPPACVESAHPASQIREKAHGSFVR